MQRLDRPSILRRKRATAGPRPGNTPGSDIGAATNT